MWFAVNRILEKVLQSLTSPFHILMDSTMIHCIFIVSKLVQWRNSVTFKGNEIRYFRGSFYLTVFRLL